MRIDAESEERSKPDILTRRQRLEVCSVGRPRRRTTSAQPGIGRELREAALLGVGGCLSWGGGWGGGEGWDLCEPRARGTSGTVHACSCTQRGRGAPRIEHEVGGQGSLQLLKRGRGLEGSVLGKGAGSSGPERQ